MSNTSAGVFIRAAGTAAAIDRFTARISDEAPPLAQITSMEVQSLDPDTVEPHDFRILASDTNNAASTAIPPDIALCRDCLAELRDPGDRRFGYPFINCTNCGPRFTIVETIPYDRPKTSMKVFAMCERCRTEYEDPANRRFHAQPNACPVCGPQLSWHDNSGRRLDCADPVRAAIDALTRSQVLAIRGLGGFHLAVDAFSDKAVALLRQRKSRPSKPLAIMVKDCDTAARFCHLNDQEKAVLTGIQHPIVLLRRRGNSGLAATLSPGVDDIGIMLAYTPLHHLLFNHSDCPAALVMTSGNISGHPICTANEAALQQLSSIADYFLLHDREILTRVDDSVGKHFAGDFRLFRRARGYSPSPLQLSFSLPPVLGCGGGLKSTFCLARGKSAFISQHIGDLFNLQSYDFYRESIAHHRQVFEIEPELAVRDLHPDYLSSRFAEESDLPIYTVQHHHAHAVAVMAEHGLTDPALAVVLDGTGYGGDSTIWGGEFLLSSLTGFTRLGHLSHLLLPGGDRAASEPWRMALSALYQLRGPDCLAEKHLPPLLQSIDPRQRQILVEMMENDFNTIPTSSCGRLFDTAAALLGLRKINDFEGHAAMELEALAARKLPAGWLEMLEMRLARFSPSFLSVEQGKWEIISSEFVKMILEKGAEGSSPAEIAREFHFQLVCAITILVKKLCYQHGLQQVVLTGGCMQNRLLMEGLFHTLAGEDLRVYTGAMVPVNDGGISLGQAVTGGLRHVSRHPDEGNENIR